MLPIGFKPHETKTWTTKSKSYKGTVLVHELSIFYLAAREHTFTQLIANYRTQSQNKNKYGTIISV